MIFRATLSVLLIFSMLTPLAADDYWPGAVWRTSTPETQGIDSEILYQTVEAVTSANLKVHSLLVIRHGYLVEEAYFFPYKKDDRHVLWSCTKSFISALTGIAIDKGFLTSVDQRLVSFYPKNSMSNLTDRKKQITLRYLLTMTSGLEWDEWNTGFDDPRNSYFQMMTADNTEEFVVNRPVKDQPGQTWVYNSGGSHLLAMTLKKSVGSDLLTFAQENLFSPLGFTNYYWRKDRQGNEIGGWGLYVRPLDMAKFGYLYLKKGKWKDRQIIPEAWVNQSVERHVPFPCNEPDQFTTGYGYQFWLNGLGGFYAGGNMGQRIFVFPRQDMVVVFTGKLGPDQLDLPDTLTREIIMKSVVSDKPLPEKPGAYSNHQILLKNLERKAPKNWVYETKDLY